MTNCSGRTFRVILALGLTFFAGMASPQDKKIVLRVADHFPHNHFMVEPLVKYWMNAVTKESGGTVAFEYFPAGQLGKATDMLSIALSGVADIAAVVPSNISDKFPLSGVVELPGSFEKGCAGTSAFWRLAAEGGVIAAKEYAPLGFWPLFGSVLPPYQVYSRVKLESLKSFEGLKLQAPGGAKEIIVRKLKAVPIRMAAPEIYESLSRGTIDGGTLSTGAILSYNLPDSAKFVTVGENFGSAMTVYGIREVHWKKLPKNVQKIMLDVGSAASMNLCGVMDKMVESEYEKLKQKGMTLVKFSPADHKEIAALAATVRTEWADALDKRGKPGSEVLKAYTQALAAGR